MILDRIDAALEKARWQQIEVRAIYLDEVDRKSFDAAMCARIKRDNGWKRYKAIHLAYGDHLIRYGTKSRIYSTHGVEIAVPKRLSRKVS